MSRRFRHLSGYLRFLLAGIALVSQLALGAVVLPDDAPQGAIAALAAASILCGGNHPSDQGPASHKHQPANPALCPISVALALPSVIPTPTPELPGSSNSVLYLRTLERPPGRGPPAATARVGAPRAPPLTA
jgi:hypothetical protein